MKHIAITLCLGFGAILASSAAVSAAMPPASFTISGDVLNPKTWTASAIETSFKSDIKVVSYVLKGQKHTAHAIPLLVLVDTADAAINPDIKHHNLQFDIAVRGFDGYTVDFSMAELLPEIGNRKVWVALDDDDNPFAGVGGPIHLVVPGDIKPARWVHGIAGIMVLDLSRPSYSQQRGK